jgi:hypothetical protein
LSRSGQVGVTVDAVGRPSAGVCLRRGGRGPLTWGLRAAPSRQSHVVPLSVNAASAAPAPAEVKLAPIDVEAPSARAPFQLALVTVTSCPDCDQVPFQPWLRCWSPA